MSASGARNESLARRHDVSSSTTTISSKPMFVLVTFAVDAEFAPWRQIRRFRKVKLNEKHWSGGADVYETQVGDCCVWVSLTGMGIKSFDFKSALCLRSAGLDAIISSGLSGALRRPYRVGQIVVPKRVGTLRDAVGLATAAPLADLAERQGATVVDTLLTSDRIIDSQEEKARLAQFADAVDMESFHIVHEFSLEAAPVTVIRAISDAANEDLPLDFSKVVTSTGQLKAAPLIKALVLRPTKIPHLIRFARQSREAAKNLVNFLDVFLRALTPESIRCEARATTAT
jgi:adenosylhomocysteine nucleosidase